MNKKVNFIDSLVRLKTCVNNLENAQIKEDFLIVEAMALITAKDFCFDNSERLTDLERYITNIDTNVNMSCGEAINVLKDMLNDNVVCLYDSFKNDTADSFVESMLFYNIVFEALTLSIESLRECKKIKYIGVVYG